MAEEGPSNPCETLTNTATCKIHYCSEDNTLVEEYCELLVLQLCSAPDKVGDVPATPLARIRCGCASELDSLSSCYTLTCGGGSLVEPVKRENMVRAERRWTTLSKPHRQNNEENKYKTY